MTPKIVPGHRHSIALTLVVVVMAGLYLPRLIGLFPLANDVTYGGDGWDSSQVDDWDAYHRYAESVLDGGLTMPAVPGPYNSPAGFGYVYFVALVYSIFGARSEVVYVVQGCLLLGVIAWLYRIFRAELSRPIAVFFLLCLAIYMWVDVFWYLTFRLLSENLLITLIAPLLFFTLRGAKTGRLTDMALAGIVCGLCVLVRPNAGLFPIAIAANLLFGVRQWSRAWRVRASGVFLCAAAVIALLLPLRDYAVTRQMTAGSLHIPGNPAADDMSPEWSLPRKALSAVALYAKHTAYTVGIPGFINPRFRIRPHWLLMWAVFAVYVLHLFRRSPAFWETLVLSLCAVYFVPIIVLAYPSNYGVRMLVPGVPLVLLLAVKEADLAFSALRLRWAAS